MSDNVISYIDMCQREGASLQAGMNFGLGGNHSVILMSVRPNAPYRDRLEDSGTTLVYEGHDHPRVASCPNPKVVDQPLASHTGRPTQNGKFFNAARAAAAGDRTPERVRVYEKLRPGIWAYNGIFHLVDAWTEQDEHRTVCKFKLVAVEGDEDLSQPVRISAERRRIIPSHVKLEVVGSAMLESVQFAAPLMNCTSITSFHTLRVVRPRLRQTCSFYVPATILPSRPASNDA